MPDCLFDDRDELIVELSGGFQAAFRRLSGGSQAALRRLSGLELRSLFTRTVAAGWEWVDNGFSKSFGWLDFVLNGRCPSGGCVKGRLRINREANFFFSTVEIFFMAFYVCQMHKGPSERR
jgi:hypothetical protein